MYRLLQQIGSQKTQPKEPESPVLQTPAKPWVDPYATGEQTLAADGLGEANLHPDDWDGTDVDCTLGADAYTAMLDVLQILGVDPVAASNFACSIRKGPPTSFLEMYNRGRMSVMAHGGRRNLNLVSVGALDLRTCKSNGQPWDFRKKSGQR